MDVNSQSQMNLKKELINRMYVFLNEANRCKGDWDDSERYHMFKCLITEERVKTLSLLKEMEQSIDRVTLKGKNSLKWDRPVTFNEDILTLNEKELTHFENEFHGGSGRTHFYKK